MDVRLQEAAGNRLSHAAFLELILQDELLEAAGMPETSSLDSIYDYPLYYDVLFGWNRDGEATFYGNVLQGCRVPPKGRILEVACGTGQVARRLARAGWQMTGLDNRPDMLRFLEDQAHAEGLRVQTICADMARFDTDVVYDAAFSPMSSFRILPDDRSVVSHLRCMASALREGGVYIVDLGFVEQCGSADRGGDDRWSMTRGTVTVRNAGDRVLVDDAESGRSLVLSWGESAALREYTAPQFAQLVSASEAFRIEARHPEAGRDGDGISIFSEWGQRDAPPAGRCMVVLRKSQG